MARTAQSARTAPKTPAKKAVAKKLSANPSAQGSKQAVPLLVFVPLRVRERLNKIVRTMSARNQSQVIEKLINDAYREAP